MKICSVSSFTNGRWKILLSVNYTPEEYNNDKSWHGDAKSSWNRNGYRLDLPMIAIQNHDLNQAIVFFLIRKKFAEQS